MTRRIGYAMMICSLLVACGDDDGMAADAGEDGGGEVESIAAPPDIPWLDDGAPPVALTPCPDGWREVTDEGGTTTCDPFPEGGAMECGPGEAHFPGEPGCAPIGSACPGGDFATDLPSDARVIYVRPGATGGDGSMSAPYGSPAEFSVGGLSTGTVIALSRGSLEAEIRLTRGLVYWGACVAETIVSTPSGSGTDGVVTARDATGEVRNLTLGASPRSGIVAQGAAARIVIEGVLANGTAFSGLSVMSGADVQVHSFVARDIQADPTTLRFGRGIDLVGGSTAQMARVVVDGARDIGLLLADDGTSGTFSDIVVRNLQGRAADRTGGGGLGVQLGAAASIHRGLIERARLTAVLVGGTPETSLTLEDVIIRDTEAQALDDTLGHGLHLQQGGTVTGRRMVIERNRLTGVLVNNESVIALEDVVVRDMRGTANGGDDGIGLTFTSGASVTVDRAILERNREIAVYVDSEGTLATFTDILIRDTRSEERTSLFGGGLIVDFGGHAVMRRALMDRNLAFGALAGNGSRMTLEDIVVRNTESQEGDGLYGRGIGAQAGSVAEVTRALVEENRDLGITTTAGDSRVTLTDVRVVGTRPHGCVDTGCAGEASGHGIASFGESVLTATNFVIDRSALCGVFLGQGGAVDLVSGEVRASEIGACVQVDGYDTNRLTNDVAYIDNETPLQATTLPVPDAIADLPSM